MRLPSGKSLTRHIKIASIIFIYVATLLPFIALSVWTVYKCGKSKTTIMVLILFVLSYVIRILLADFVMSCLFFLFPLKENIWPVVYFFYSI